MRKNRWTLPLLLALLASSALRGQSFVNWENPHVHPVDLSPSGDLLLVVNTPDNRLEVFDATASLPRAVAAVPVGLDPVSVRARTETEAWVVNHISDSISVVDLATFNVRATLTTLDEPADVIFAGSPQRAFVTCSQANAVLVFDPANLAAAAVEIAIDGEDPRALAASADGSKVYAAIFESGNASTILGGGGTRGGFPPNVVNDASGPYGGTNPPPNDGSGFNPAIRPEYLPGGAAPAPAVGMIVKKDAAGRWMDDNTGDWTALVSGPQAASSGRRVGWDLPDHDVAVIDTATLDVTYATGLLNLVMAVAVQPASGEVTVVGTDATNEIRFEPVLKARFLRVAMGLVTPGSLGSATVVDLNGGHLDYSDAQVAAQSDTATASQALRDRSLGDPRGIVWNGTGTRGYVTGMGSDNVVVIDAAGQRLNPLGAPADPAIEVGEGPTGLALDGARQRLYVVNKFSASVSLIDTATEQPVGEVPFFDPTPAPIRSGRRHLYDTHRTSGLGHVSCGSCHADARMDRLSWDLGDPSGDIKALNSTPGQHNLGMNVPGLNQGFEDFHPMKGPMTTQTLQDIIGKEPLHWRGDRDGLEEFNGAFRGLLGDDVQLTPTEMQEFEDFLASIHFPPNPFRHLDNSLPEDLALSGHFSDGRFAAQGGLGAGDPLPNGDAVAGLALFRPPFLLDGALACVTCHALPTGAGADVTLVGTTFQDIPPGPDGERHLALVSVDGSTNVTMKTPHLRNLYEKVGFETTQISNRAGAGFGHDGSIDSIARFVSEPVFSVANDQEVADLVAFMLAFSGSDLPEGSRSVFDLEPPGPVSLDSHAAVGSQITFDASNREEPGAVARLAELQALADAGAVGLVAKGRQAGETRGYAYQGGGTLQSDRAAETLTVDALRLAAGSGTEVTFTLVPSGSQGRIGTDRDEDGFLDRDELDGCSDPADAGSIPGSTSCALFSDGFESGDASAWSSAVPRSGNGRR